MFRTLFFLLCLGGQGSESESPPLGAELTRAVRISTSAQEVVPGMRGKPARSPNILIIIADDMGVDMVRDYDRGGSDFPHTPHLEELVAQGILFENAWCGPLCSPTRATIQTGRYGFQTGIGRLVHPHDAPLPITEMTLPEMLDAGTGGLYDHAAIGKWHLGHSPTAPNDSGWGHFSGTLSNLDPPFGYYRWEKVVDGQTSVSHDYATTDNVDEALGWLGQRSSPWLLYLAFNAPHNPFHEPPADLHTTEIPGPLSPAYERNRAMYKAMIEALDAEMGRLLANLSPEVLANTVIFFLADNGTGRVVIEDPPFDRKHGKGTLYEGGINVPFIVAGRSVAKGARSRALVNTSDVFATVAELAGVDLERVMPPGVKLNSVSLVPYLKNPDRPSIRTVVFSERFTVNGSLEPFPAIEESRECHEDLGYSGPGDLGLQICGPRLALGNSVDLDLIGGPASTRGILLETDELDPTPWNGGVIISSEALQVPVATDEKGTLFLPGFVTHLDENETGSTRRYVQVALEDADQPGGYAISNAVSIKYRMANQKAIRNADFKLITNLCGREELYDLKADPFEGRDLLLGGPLGLDPEARNAYDALRMELDRLRQSR